MLKIISSETIQFMMKTLDVSLKIGKTVQVFQISEFR